ncbi:30S ribosomal protein S10 [candidate division bacterium WOR-3 4484_18]|uniref:Small ribosomal subunit protein uS10 n=1 Tax=candidate division WOR-3 bacterium 4484_18 TaxID=2020626 RepID=A0A257LVR2_UNCW3|nr:30S ribosomal protein S10 [candidate division WOR-3 bacterium]OYV03512.1 MAG: 30S ribosomal protein S10 [candidate division bacterium WOR-3 4484_18]
MARIRIKLKSYDHVLLDKACRELVESMKNTGAEISGPIPLPTKRTVVTVLRSPHINKRSREQFELRIHKRLIEIKRFTTRTREVLQRLNLPAGVEAEIKV